MTFPEDKIDKVDFYFFFFFLNTMVTGESKK